MGDNGGETPPLAGDAAGAVVVALAAFCVCDSRLHKKYTIATATAAAKPSAETNQYKSRFVDEELASASDFNSPDWPGLTDVFNETSNGPTGTGRVASRPHRRRTA